MAKFQKYKLTVIAEDGGVPSNSATEEVIMRVDSLDPTKVSFGLRIKKPTENFVIAEALSDIIDDIETVIHQVNAKSRVEIMEVIDLDET